jgi:hypothetical protein
MRPTRDAREVGDIHLLPGFERRASRLKSRPPRLLDEGAARAFGEELPTAGAQIVVSRAVEEVVDPVPEDLRPEVADAALAQQGEVGRGR